MITHDQVASEVQFLKWQIAAWQKVKDAAHAPNRELALTEIQYLQERIETLKEWDDERWEVKEKVYA